MDVVLKAGNKIVPQTVGMELNRISERNMAKAGSSRNQMLGAIGLSSSMPQLPLLGICVALICTYLGSGDDTLGVRVDCKIWHFGWRI